MKTNGRILVAGLAGLAAGVIAGVLMAPRSGKETRRKMSDAKDEWGDRFREGLEDGKRSLSDVREKIGSRFRHAENKEPESIT
jgi:gas vesicle protein